jgi:hypothetical protein
MSREDAIEALLAALGPMSTDNRISLSTAMHTALRPMASPLDVQVEALSTLGFWVEFTGDQRRRAAGPDKLKYQYIEGHLESQARAIDKGIVATMHHNNMAERQYHNSGR